jgi:hypothetical protein
MASIAFTTNFTLNVPDITKQQETIRSFFHTFKPSQDIQIFVLYDDKPLSKIEKSFKLANGTECNDYKPVCEEYIKNLKNIPEFENAHFIHTKSLCDGYKQVLRLCNTPYLFFLEHDWIFLPNITHTLEDLMLYLDNHQEINCILFNKFKNIKFPFQSVQQLEHEIPVCLTSRQSNNPNLMRVDHALKVKDVLINENGCSVHPNIEFKYSVNGFLLPNYCGGIECELTEYCDKYNLTTELGTVLYGPLNYLATVTHSDGCDRNILEKGKKIF